MLNRIEGIFHLTFYVFHLSVEIINNSAVIEFIVDLLDIFDSEPHNYRNRH